MENLVSSIIWLLVILFMALWMFSKKFRRMVTYIWNIKQVAIIRKPIAAIIDKIIETTWIIYAEIVFEPILWIFALLLIFNRVQPIFEQWLANPQSDLWAALGADMSHNQILYNLFIIAFIIWAFIKFARIAKDNRRDKTLSQIAKTLSDIKEILNDGKQKPNSDSNKPQSAL